MSVTLLAAALAVTQVTASLGGRLSEPLPVTSDVFGVGIEIDNDTLAIASKTIQQGHGVVHVYRGCGASWTLEAELQDPTPPDQNHFGRALALQGDELIVGAMQDTHSTAGTTAGSAHVFRRTGTTWAHTQLLEPTVPVHLGGYGNDLKVVDDTLVVTGYGQIHVYGRQGASWVEETTLPMVNALAWGGSYRLAFDGTRIVVGSVCSPIPGVFCAGRVHVFVRTPGGWLLEQVLAASDQSVNSALGVSVAIDGERIVAGAVGSPNGTNTGAAYVFERAAGAWSEVQRIAAADAVAGMWFGRSVTLSDDRLYVGADETNVGAVNDAGALYVFERRGSRWLQSQKFPSPSPSAGGEFGWRQAKRGNHLFVAAPGQLHSNVPFAGAVYVLTLEPSVVSYCLSATTTLGCRPRMLGTGVPSASENSGFTLRADFLEGLSAGLFFYGVSGRTYLPWGATAGGGYLCVKPPIQRLPVQNSGGAPGACNGVLQTDWNAFRAASPISLGEPFSCGAVINAQAWYRDVGAPKTTALTNALEFVLQP